MNNPGLLEALRAHTSDIVAIRRDIHAHPELGFSEHRTADVIEAALSRWRIPSHRGLGKTGVVGILKGRDGGRSIGIRADIDALPMTERNEFGHASVHAGVMHACGHDGHVAMLLAAARHLAQHRDFSGTVYLVFQPAEEGAGGAHAMIRDGLFERFPMEAIFGVHNWPGLKVGQFAIGPGPMFGSSSSFKVTIRGRGAHGAFPHEGIDPIPAACQMVQAFQTIMTRNKRPTEGGVISVTMIHAGEAFNASPDSCEIQGTVRTFTTQLLDLVERRMRQIAEATCSAFEADCEFQFDRIIPATINHRQEAEFVKEVLTNLVGAQNVLAFEPTSGAEDFSYFLQERPGCYFVVGNGEGEHKQSAADKGPCILHSPYYDFNDELIPLGGAMWVQLVHSWLARSDPAAID
jgi:amidohydrolase